VFFSLSFEAEPSATIFTVHGMSHSGLGSTLLLHKGKVMTSGAVIHYYSLLL